MSRIAAHALTAAASGAAAPRPAAGRTGGVSQVAIGERIAAGLLSAVCLTVLIVAACLTPSLAGHGTHQQLGLPPCGWLVTTGYPCPTCGMTTAFAAATEGHWLASVRAQPFGTMLCLATAAIFWGALHVAAFGSRIGRLCGKLLRPRWIWLMAGAWGASWAYEIATWGAR